MTLDSHSTPLLTHEFPLKLDIVNAGVRAFAETLRQEVAGEDEYMQAAVGSYISLLERGGKRLRGVLTMTGYELYNGADLDMISHAAGAVEACHAYLLVLDDVADNSPLRRGAPAAHIQMRNYFAQRHIPGDITKLGMDVAQTAASYAQHKAQCAILGLNVAHQQKIRAANIFNAGLARTGLGQIRDIAPGGYDDSSVDYILKTATYKTVYYSFSLPLQVGAVLAGASTGELHHFEAYCLHAGLAFQLQDDIVGTFGDEKITGKSRMSDIIEGKKTWLMARTLEKAKPADRKILLQALGNSNLQESEFARCLKIIRRTGALEETRSLISSHTQSAIKALDYTPARWAARPVEFLRAIARYGEQRQS